MTTAGGHLAAHLVELRQRLLVCVASLVVISAVVYAFAEPVAAFLIKPLFTAYPSLVRLVYTNLTEAFVSYIKMSLLVGLACSFPVFVYEIWMYVAPGLYDSEKRVAFTVMATSSLLFAGGVCFSYFVVLPKVLSFFMTFAGENIEPLPKLGGYLTFVARFSFAFGLAFEIPFLMVVAGRTGVIRGEYFAAKRKYFYMVIAGLSFLLAAGDFFSAGLLFVPLVILYETGIVLLKMFGKKVEVESDPDRAEEG